jgi:hypothetical protein
VQVRIDQDDESHLAEIILGAGGNIPVPRPFLSALTEWTNVDVNVEAGSGINVRTVGLLQGHVRPIASIIGNITSFRRFARAYSALWMLALNKRALRSCHTISAAVHATR